MHHANELGLYLSLSLIFFTVNSSVHMYDTRTREHLHISLVRRTNLGKRSYRTSNSRIDGVKSINADV